MRQWISFGRTAIAILVSTSLIFLPILSNQVRALDRPAPLEIYKKAIKTLETAEPILSYVADQLDHSVYDVSVLADKLGTDPIAAFEFVRDNIGYRAYFGNLRGADGVLVDRVGNALDRSLLLATLLAENGRTVRIAHAILDPEIAQKIAKRTFEPTPRAPGVIALTPEILAVFLNEGGMTADDIRATFRQQEEVVRSTGRKFRAIAKPALAELSEAIDAAGLELPMPPDIEVLAKEAQEHFWVQLEGPDGTWSDLDPTFIKSVAGERLVPPDLSFPIDEIPYSLRHRVGIRAILSVSRDGIITDKTLIDETVDVDGQVGKALRLSNFPLGADTGRLAKGVGNLEALGSLDTFLITLTAPDRPLVFQYYNLDGELLDGPPDLAKALGTGLGGGLSGGLRPLLAPGPASSSGQVVGLRVEYLNRSSRGIAAQPLETRSVREIVSPRTVEKWSPENGPEFIPLQLDRTALATQLIWSSELAVIPADISPEYAAYLSLKYQQNAFRDADRKLRFVLGLPASENPDLLPEQLPWILYAVAASATQVMDAGDTTLSATNSDVAQYLNRATLLAWELNFRSADESGIVSRNIIDIIGIGDRVSLDGEANTDLYRKTILQIGVSWTALERIILDQRQKSVSSPSNQSTNLTRILADARDQGIALQAIGVGDLAAVAKLSLPPQLKFELADAVSNQTPIVVLSKKLPGALAPNGWWALDPVSAIPIGRMPGGRGQSGTQTSILDNTMAEEAAASSKVWHLILRGTIAALGTVYCMGKVKIGSEDESGLVTGVKMGGCALAGIIIGTGLIGGLLLEGAGGAVYWLGTTLVAISLASVVGGDLLLNWAEKQ